MFQISYFFFESLNLLGSPDKPNQCFTHSSYEAMLQQGRQYVDNALFQAGGVNYSGTSCCVFTKHDLGLLGQLHDGVVGMFDSNSELSL